MLSLSFSQLTLTFLINTDTRIRNRSVWCVYICTECFNMINNAKQTFAQLATAAIFGHDLRLWGFYWKMTLHWRHNGHDSVSNHQPHDCLLNRLFRRRSKKTSKLRVTGLCAGNSPTGEFPLQMVSSAENVSIWWRHHDLLVTNLLRFLTHNNIHLEVNNVNLRQI